MLHDGPIDFKPHTGPYTGTGGNLRFSRVEMRLKIDPSLGDERMTNGKVDVMPHTTPYTSPNTTENHTTAPRDNDVLSPPARGLLEHDSALGCRMATMG